MEAVPLYSAFLDFLDIAFTALVVDRVQWSPLPLHCRIGLHLHLRLSPLDAILLIDRNQVGKEERIGTFGTILRKDADQQEIDNLGLVELDGTQEMPPSEWQHSASMALLQSDGQGRHGNADTHQLALIIRPILDQGDKLQVEHTKVHLDVLVDLLLCEL